ncbi:hypothetical protein PsAD2_03756 [Pseudovibrio axinellae]|uniref:Uncharacterized protein n=1 Tax=Pseudovibrio axinellae TaxID=989403 RepID=A0A165VMJ0_9HYPH|nr:hypothetical protein [Pseudovibrio axinellae]KZL14461.1 hypothetical protein PsAD2_03756 [Pseudovibrio axinellae]SER85176.1 hypothetical protein SAMN05421798_1382 [Pseudovibrio axinellae]
MPYQFEQMCCVDEEIPFKDVGAPANVMNTPGMLSKKERRLLYTMGKNVFQGKGRIVDAGSFMGASCVALAQGVSDNPIFDISNFDQGTSKRSLISAYDMGFMPAQESGDEKFKQFGEVIYRFGDSFVEIFLDNIRPFENFIETNIGDLLSFEWDEEPIELLFVDVCKSVKLNQHVNKQFFPHLIPGVSRVINQDFYFDRLPWCKVTMGYLSEYFEWQGQAMSSAIYKLKKPIPNEVLNYDPFTQGSLTECLKYHDMHERPYHGDRERMLLGLSRAFLMTLKGDKKGAINYLDYISQEYGDCVHDPVRGEMNAIRYNRTVQQIKSDSIRWQWGDHTVPSTYKFQKIRSLMQSFFGKRLSVQHHR